MYCLYRNLRVCVIRESVHYVANHKKLKMGSELVGCWAILLYMSIEEDVLRTNTLFIMAYSGDRSSSSSSEYWGRIEVNLTQEAEFLHHSCTIVPVSNVIGHIKKCVMVLRGYSRPTFGQSIVYPSTIYSVPKFWSSWDSFRLGWDSISIKLEPVVSWHISWFWVLKWGGMSCLNEQLWQTLDIDNMFEPTFGFKIFDYQNIYNLPVFYLLAWEKTTPPYTSPDLAQNPLRHWLWAPLLCMPWSKCSPWNTPYINFLAPWTYSPLVHQIM